jgi:hypothetical protein
LGLGGAYYLADRGVVTLPWFPREEEEEPQLDWRQQVRDWWVQRLQEGNGIDRDQLARPYLRIHSRANTSYQIGQLERDEPGTVTFEVLNEGSFPSWTCYVELFEGPFDVPRPISDFESRGRTIVSIQAGQRRDVDVPWLRTMPRPSSMAATVYDPLLDPRVSQVEAVHRQLRVFEFPA